MPKIKLGAVTQKKLDAFDEAAQIWGWEADQGGGRAVDKAKAKYEATKLALVHRLVTLEERAR